MSPHSTSVSSFETMGSKPRVSMVADKARLRTSGAGLTNFMRNIGIAIGVFIASTILANSVQTIHAQLAQYAAPFNGALGVNSESMFMNPLIPFGMSGQRS
jgi:hypothetical protein